MIIEISQISTSTLEKWELRVNQSQVPPGPSLAAIEVEERARLDLERALERQRLKSMISAAYGTQWVPIETPILESGTRLRGYCYGAFGDSYEDKVVFAMGSDWLVARGVVSNQVHFTQDLDLLRQCLADQEDEDHEV